MGWRGLRFGVFVPYPESQSANPRLTPVPSTTYSSFFTVLDGMTGEGRSIVFAIVQCMGFQYRVVPDERVKIPATDLEPGSTLVLDQVLLIRDGESVKVGAPTVAGAKVEVEVVRHGRGKKILVGKYKKRKGYRKRNGHRQNFTEVVVRTIQS
jgi:large subunit ribosomal protein L21